MNYLRLCCSSILQLDSWLYFANPTRLVHALHGVQHAVHHIIVYSGHVCWQAWSPRNFTRPIVVTCLSDSVLSGMLLSFMLDSTFVEMVLAIVALSSNTLFIRVPAFLGDFLFSKYSFLSLFYQCLQGHEFQVLVVHRWTFAWSNCFNYPHPNDLKALKNSSDFESSQPLLQVIWSSASENNSVSIIFVIQYCNDPIHHITGCIL